MTKVVSRTRKGSTPRLLDQEIAAAQRPHRPADARVEQIIDEDERADHDQPDQIVDLVAAAERHRPDGDRGNRRDAVVAAEPVDVAETERDREPPGDRTQRQEVSLQTQRHVAEAGRGRASHRGREPQAEPWRLAPGRRQPRRRIGAQPHERGLPERNETADPRQQDEADRDQRVDPDVVEQRHRERGNESRRRQDRDDGENRSQLRGPSAHSSMSSSEGSDAIERQSRTGISRENTMTSLKALL